MPESVGQSLMVLIIWSRIGEHVVAAPQRSHPPYLAIRHVSRECVQLYLLLCGARSYPSSEQPCWLPRVAGSCFVAVRSSANVLKGTHEMQCFSVRVSWRQAARGHVLWNPPREFSARFAPSRSLVQNALVWSRSSFHEPAALTHAAVQGNTRSSREIYSPCQSASLGCVTDE